MNNCVINTVKVFQFSLVLNDQVEEGNGSLGFQCCEARNAIYEEKREAANKNKSLKGEVFEHGTAWSWSSKGLAVLLHII